MSDFRPDRERDPDTTCPPPVRPERTVIRSAPARGCKCGKRMLEQANEGTCLWCGHGRARAVLEHAYARNMERNESAVVASAAPRVRQLRPHIVWTEDECVAAYRRWQAHFGRAPASADWQSAMVAGEPRRPGYAAVLRLFGGWQAFLRYIADVPRQEAA